MVPEVLEVFNWSKVHLSKVTSYKIHVLASLNEWHIHFLPDYSQLSYLAVRSRKKCPNQETGLGNRGCQLLLKLVCDTFGKSNMHRTLDLLGLDFFCGFLQQDSSSAK